MGPGQKRNQKTYLDWANFSIYLCKHGKNNKANSSIENQNLGGDMVPSPLDPHWLRTWPKYRISLLLLNRAGLIVLLALSQQNFCCLYIFQLVFEYLVKH